MTKDAILLMVGAMALVGTGAMVIGGALNKACSAELTPMPVETIDFGPRPPPTEAETAYWKSVEMGPRLPHQGLGTDGCPLPGYTVRLGHRLEVISGDRMVVSVKTSPFRVEKGGILRIRESGQLRVTQGCD